MESKTNFPHSLAVGTMAPLDDKNSVKTFAELLDLGWHNYKAYYYYRGLVIYCHENHKRYEWTDKFEPGVEKLLPEDYTYPRGTKVNDIDYSHLSFNFIPFNSGEKVIEPFRVSSPIGSFEYGEITPERMTSEDAIKKMLTKVEYAEIVSTGNVSLSGNNSSLYEIGHNLTINLTANVDRGIIKGSFINGIWDKDNQNPYRGIINSYTFKDNNNVSSGAKTTNTHTFTSKLKQGTNTYTLEVDFAEKGYFANSEDTNQSIVAAQKLTATRSTKAIYRTFLGALNSVPINGTDLRTSMLSSKSQLSESKEFSFNTNEDGRFLIVAIDPSKSLILAENNGTKENLLNQFVLSTSITQIPDASGTLINYKVYVLETTIAFKNQTINIKTN